MNACMYVCIMYVCMFVLQSARHLARRSLFGALCGVAVYQVKYARIEKICIYRRADYTGSTIYVRMHACMYVLYMYVSLYSNRRAIPRRLLIGALIGALCGMDESL